MKYHMVFNYWTPIDVLDFEIEGSKEDLISACDLLGKGVQVTSTITVRISMMDETENHVEVYRVDGRRLKERVEKMFDLLNK